LILYLVNTQIIFKTKLDSDTNLITSARWLGVIQPHPIYRSVHKKYPNISPDVTLIAVQLLYTSIALTLNFIIFNNKKAQLVVLLGSFAYATWSASVYYFDDFADRYTKKLEKELTKLSSLGPRVGTWVPPMRSVIIFFIYIFASISIVVYIQNILLG